MAGYYFDGTGRHGFVYSNGAFTTLDAPGATNGFYDGIDHGTVPANINASGQVVGYYFDGAGPHGGPHGFVYSGGTFTLLNVPGALATWATRINDNGQVTGSYEDGSSRYIFVYSGSTFTTLNIPNAADEYYGPSINASGQVAGSYFDVYGGHGFMYSGGTFTYLNVPGALATFATRINDNGQVIGSYCNSTYRYGGFTDCYSFVYSGDTFTTALVHK